MRIADADPRSGTRAAYKDFITLWKDADPDIPVLKEAKAEYAKIAENENRYSPQLGVLLLAI